MEDKNMVELINTSLHELHTKCLETKKEFFELHAAANKKDLEFNEYRSELRAYLELAKLDKYQDTIDWDIIRTINRQNSY